MTTFEIKKKLIDQINLSNNKNLLEELYRFLNLENEIQELYQLNTEQQSAIAEARKQITNGDHLTDDEANQEIDEWLDK
jgi:PHD/YefM family antitoxin component YafN of YafNO toxin-antitoxin module